LDNQAAIIAVRSAATQVGEGHFESAVERVIGGIERKIPEYEVTKGTVAVHECGHAVTSWFLEGGSPLLKVTSIADHQAPVKGSPGVRPVSTK